MSIDIALADLGGTRGAPPPTDAQVLSISCSFQENLAKPYVGLPGGNPGSATEMIFVNVNLKFIFNIKSLFSHVILKLITFLQIQKSAIQL